jgi:hypothetical protein
LLERAVLSQSLAIFAEVGDRYGRAAALHSLGRLRRAQRQPAEAVTHLRKAAAMYYELGSRRDESRAPAELQLAQEAAETQSTIVDGSARRCRPAGHRRLSLAAVGIRGIGGR